MIRNFILNFSKIFVSRTVVVAKPLVSGIPLSTSLIFVLKTILNTKPLVSGIFLSKSSFSSLNFVYLYCIDLWELK